jgi:hypothetical protein
VFAHELLRRPAAVRLHEHSRFVRELGLGWNLDGGQF